MSRFEWNARQVGDALALEVRRGAQRFGSVSTDTRSINAGDLFVALRGERFDGHDFVEQAVVAGAGGVVVERAWSEAHEDPASVVRFEVEDTLVALGDLAHHRRRALEAAIVCITGSSGKTTTKDLTRGALATSFRTHATQGNFNNRIGLPLTLLGTPDEAEVVVLEIGTNEPGEIRALTQIARPRIGVVTTVSETHLEKLGSLEGVLDEKLDLVRGLSSEGIAVVGDDPPMLAEGARAIAQQVRVAGWTERADPDLRPVDAAAGDEARFGFGWKNERVHLRIPGRAAVTDALLALAVADILEAAPDRAARGVSEVEPGWMRSQVRHLGSLRVILDCYNANPQSVDASLDLLVDMGGGRETVAVLGSMLELGERADALHAEVLRAALARPVDRIVASGLFAAAARSELSSAEDGRLIVEPDIDRIAARLSSLLSGDEVVLLKASRGARLERVLPELEARFEATTGGPA